MDIVVKRIDNIVVAVKYFGHGNYRIKFFDGIVGKGKCISDKINVEVNLCQVKLNFRAALLFYISIIE